MAAELAVIGTLVVWTVVANLARREAALPLNLAAVALLLLVARRAGLSWELMGLGKAGVSTRARIGAIAAGAVAAAVAVIALVPSTREYLADDRFIGVGVWEMLYETLVRIPIGTALAEEIAFRGVLLGLLLLWLSPFRAVVISSVLFGLWHIWPAIEALETNPAADLTSGPFATILEVGIQVLVAAAAGAAFARLRIRGGSLMSPVLAHWALNGTAYLAGWLVVENSWT
ncbi:MAG: CPBP family intramembrane glutamic endopeptidase [Acidimicrobiia bacterium]